MPERITHLRPEQRPIETIINDEIHHYLNFMTIYVVLRNIADKK